MLEFTSKYLRITKINNIILLYNLKIWKEKYFIDFTNKKTD